MDVENQAPELVDETPPGSGFATPETESDPTDEVTDSSGGQILVEPKVPPETVQNFDFSSLKLGEEEVWDIRVAFMGVFDVISGVFMDPQVPTGPLGVFPLFELHCYTDTFVDAIGEAYDGLPTKEHTLSFIKRCIIFITSSENGSGLPKSIRLCHNLREYSEFLTPFLDSLPCDWAIQSLELTQSVSLMLDVDRSIDIEMAMERAFIQKELGNEAVRQNDPTEAIVLYEDALICVSGALYHHPFCGSLERATHLLAICHSNIAAAYLMPGDRQDARLAVEHAKKAVEIEPDYVKGYLHLSRAYETLGEEKKLREVIQIVRRIHGFKQNPNLVEIANRLETKATENN